MRPVNAIAGLSGGCYLHLALDPILRPVKMEDTQKDRSLGKLSGVGAWW
jgi:hypothetical protein